MRFLKKHSKLFWKHDLNYKAFNLDDMKFALASRKYKPM